MLHWLQANSQLVLGPDPVESCHLEQPAIPNLELVRLVFLGQSAPNHALPAVVRSLTAAAVSKVVAAVSKVAASHQFGAKKVILAAEALNVADLH